MFKNLFFLLIAFFCSIILWSKENDFSFLEKTIKKWESKKGYKADSILYELYIEIGDKYIDFNIDTAIYFYKKSLEKANSLKNNIKITISRIKLLNCFFIKKDTVNAFKEFNVAINFLNTIVNIEEEKKKRLTLELYDKVWQWFYQEANYNKALFYLKIAYSIAKELKDDKYLGSFLKRIGYIYYVLGDYTKALEYFQMAIKIYEKYNNETEKAILLENIANVFFDKADYEQALNIYYKVLKIKKKINNKKGISITLTNIANVYVEQGNYTLAIDYYFKALKNLNQAENKHYYGNLYLNIGNVYNLQEEYLKSLNYYFKALSVYEEVNDKEGKAIVLGNIGTVYKDLKKLDSALNFCHMSLKLCEELNDKLGCINNLINIGSIYLEKKEYYKGLKFFFQALDLKVDDKKNLAIIYNYIGDAYLKLNYYNKAEYYIKKSIKIAEEINLINYLVYFYKNLFELYFKKKRYKEALETHLKYTEYKDSIYKFESKKALIQKEMQYLFEKQQEVEKANYEKKIAIEKEGKKKQRIIIIFVSTGFFVTSILAFFIFRALQITKEQKRIIEFAKEEISKQKDLVEKQKILVEQKNKEITDSINYAKRIQNIILPDKTIWKSYLPQSFVIYLPRDIVSGDFYWLSVIDDFIFIAVADCTGHGVPGAMVSITCYNALYKAILEEKILNTNEILNKTREIVIKSLCHSYQEQLRDGMDICLVRIKREDNIYIQYSGANLPLIIVSDNKLIKINPDKQPIGYSESLSPFTYKNFCLKQGSFLYLFSDGFQDQFGGHENKKIGSKRFRELLLEASKKDVFEQEVYLKNFFYHWKGNENQTDDVTVVGIKISF